MSYFTDEFFTFFEGLSQNNYKEWFHANKKTYEKEVKAPFYQLVNDVIELVRKDIDPGLPIAVKDAVFRINRDIRFSKDKTPYKLHVAAAVSRGGRRDHSRPGIYFHIGLNSAHVGGGCYQLSKEDLYKVRSAIAQDPAKVASLSQMKAFKDRFGAIKGDKNKILPKEFKEAAKQEPLIANKQFYYMADYSPKDIALRDDLASFIVDHYKVALPWNNFLTNAISIINK